jgi:DNA-binding CsgD family transcriptional regulator
MDPQRSIEKLEEGAGLFEQLGDSAGLALCISIRGNARMLLGDLVGARSDCLRGVAGSTAAGDRQAAAWALESAGAAALLARNWDAAVDELSRAADDFAERSTPLGVCRSLFELSIAHQMRGDWMGAIDACERALQYERDYRLVAEWADIIDVVARLSGELRRFRTAAKLHGASAGWRAAYEPVSYAPQMRSILQPDRIRRQLGQRAWTDLYAAGGRLGIEEATELALSVLDDLRKEVGLSSTGLSRRQIEVLRLVAEGLGDAEIANRLTLSRRTVQAHLRSIYQKLNVTSRTAAVRAAHAIPGMSVVD